MKSVANNNCNTDDSFAVTTAAAAARFEIFRLDVVAKANEAKPGTLNGNYFDDYVSSIMFTSIIRLMIFVNALRCVVARHRS